jgi:hypothetical protein
VCVLRRPDRSGAAEAVKSIGEMQARAALAEARRGEIYLSERVAELEKALREIHEYNCGCDEPGRFGLCVAQPVVLFAVLSRETPE